MNRRTALAAIFSMAVSPIVAAPAPSYVPLDPTKPGDAGFLGKRDKRRRKKRRRKKAKARRQQ